MLVTYECFRQHTPNLFYDPYLEKRVIDRIAFRRYDFRSWQQGTRRGNTGDVRSIGSGKW